MTPSQSHRDAAAGDSPSARVFSSPAARLRSLPLPAGCDFPVAGPVVDDRPTPRPVVADMTATPWSLAVETPMLSAAIQVPPMPRSPSSPPSSKSPPAPASPRKSRPPSQPVVRFRLAHSIMRSGRHRHRDRGHTFPRSPYPVEDFLDLTRPDGRPWFAARRLQRAQELHDARDSSCQTRTAQEAFDDFFRHVGGRMAAGSLAIIESPRLDSPYIRLAEEVAYVHRLDALLVRVISEDPGSFRDCELVCFVGEFRYWYGWNRSPFAKDLWDEHRLRNSARSFPNAAFGWHHRAFHNVNFEDRARLFWPMPSGWSAFEVNRVLGVPSPSIAHYAATAYHSTAAGSPARQVLDRISFWNTWEMSSFPMRKPVQTASTIPTSPTAACVVRIIVIQAASPVVC